MTRIAKGKQSGELWDRVQLFNGIIGYVFQSYLKEVPKAQIEKISVSIDNTTINIGETKKLTVKILPEEAKNNAITYTSSNSTIVKVDGSGNVTGINPGTATITVKAKENNVSDKIEIHVYAPVKDMTLNADSVMIEQGGTFTIIPTISPSNATNQNVKYSTNNADIAKVDANGKITAISQGTTVIIAKTEDKNIEKQIQVTVVPKIEKENLAFAQPLKIEENRITGWNINELSVNKIKEKIKTIYEVQIYNSKNELLTDEQLAGTGSKIKILENEKVIMEYDIVIYGDVNGDGKINTVDLLVLQRHILEIEKFKRSVFEGWKH